MIRCAALLLPALLLAALPARADTGLAVGDRAPPVLEIAGKQVPLPQGTWIIAGRAPGTVMADEPLGAYGTIWTLVLFHLAPGTDTLDAMAEINVNDIAVQDGWGIAADCQRRDLVLSVVRSRAGWDASCYFVTHSLWHWQARLPDAWRQAEAMAASRQLRLPDSTVTAGFRAANRRDVVDVRYHFLAAFPGIAEWSAMMSGNVEAGLKNRLSASQPPPLPGAPPDQLERGSVLHEREERLDYLRASGLLSPAQFDRQTELLWQAAAATSQNAIDPATEGFDRLLGFQGLSVASDALVTFLWTAQSLQATEVTFIQAGLRTGRNYLMGYVWDFYGGSPTRPDTARTVDFRYGGVDR